MFWVRNAIFHGLRLLDMSPGSTVLLPSYVCTTVPEAVEWLQDNQDCYAEITMQVKTFLTSEDLRDIQKAHPALVAIVPDVRDDDERASFLEPA